MEFRVMGSLEVLTGGRPVPLGGPRQRAVLAALLASPNETVGRARLVDLVWDEPPPSAEANLRRYVWRLRDALRDERDTGPRIAWERGFRLLVRPGELDVWRFDEAAAEGRQALAESRPADAARALRRALALVRGEPYQGVEAGLRFEPARTLLVERHESVLEQYFQARLDLGEHAELVEELRAAHARHPARERLAGQLMLALYRSGRRGDALAAYRDLRGQLVGMLGVEPGAELQELHRQVLRADPALEATRPGGTASPRRPVALLPLALPAFTGRRAELALLDGAGPVTVVTGTAGVGKTTLVVHWAHAARAAFADGQLYVDLRGFTPGEDALDPAEALHLFLGALGVPASQIPADVEARIARYRDLLAGRQLLVVLDNARDDAQVRPLLPGGPDCRTVVTSRQRLTGLTTTTGADVVSVDVLSAAQARQLLTARLGAARVDADPAAVERIVTRCALLPLALALVAARAAGRPRARLADLADELDAVSVLDSLQVGDPAADPRTLFAWSYAGVGATAARMFRLLGLHPGPHVSAAAAASLAGLELRAAVAALTELVEAQLLTRQARDRYGRHDLLAAFAAELAAGEITPAEQEAALRRMHDHYLGTACRAMLLLDPYRPLVPPAPPPAERLDDNDEATAWFDAEYPVLFGAVAHAHRHGLPGHAWRLAWALHLYQVRTGRIADVVTAQRTAVLAAADADDLMGRATASKLLNHGFYLSGRQDEADAGMVVTQRLFRQLGDRSALAGLCLMLCWRRDVTGDYPGMLEVAREGQALYRECGDPIGEAKALGNAAWALAELGDDDAAIAECRAALDLFAGAEAADLTGEAYVWHTLGHIHRRLGRYPEAAGFFRHAIEIRRSINFWMRLPEYLHELGDVYAAMGADDEAGEVRKEAALIRAKLG